MQFDSELEKYATMGMHGGAELKADEKKCWLGDYRERIIFALSEEQVNKKEALAVLKKEIEHDKTDKIVVRSDVSEIVKDKLMDIAKNKDITYKQVEKNTTKGPIVVTIASSEAVEKENVLIDRMPHLPEIFKKSKNKYLCDKHMEILKKEAPFYVNEYETINFLDKLFGKECGVCSQKNNGNMI